MKRYKKVKILCASLLLLFTILFDATVTVNAQTNAVSNDSIEAWVKTANKNHVLLRDYSQYNYVFLSRYSDDTVQVFYSGYPFEIYYNDSYQKYILTTHASGIGSVSQYYCDKYEANNTTYTYPKQSVGYFDVNDNADDIKARIKYSNSDIVGLYGNGVFFYPPIQPILMPVTQKVEMDKTLTQVVGLIPLLILLVVGFLGLRKALRMLLAILHRA